MLSEEFEEVPRDCRGCHIFAAEAAERKAPQDSCTNCHYRGQFEARFASGFDSDLGPLESLVAAPGFEHHEHLKLACRVCHLPQSEFRVVPAALPVPRGFAHCKRCHESGVPAEEYSDFLMGEDPVTAPSTLEEAPFLARLNQDPGMGPDQLGLFFHSDHVLDLEKAQALDAIAQGEGADGNCGACHQAAFEWKGREAPQPEYGLGSCDRCHIRRGDTVNAEPIALEFELSAILPPRPSRSLGTFDHSDHLAEEWPADMKSSPEAREGIASKGCLTCHLYSLDSEGTDYQTVQAMIGDKRSEHPTSDYEGCVECHVDDGWKAAIHGDWGRTGAEGRPGSCVECHAFGLGDMKLDRPTIAVRRPRPRTFRVARQAHPFITSGQGAERIDDCKRCHLAELDFLPSRLGRREFNHAVHLPETVEERHCLECHESAIRYTDGPEEVGRIRGTEDTPIRAGDSQFGLTYEPKACERCHFGTVLVPDIPLVDEAPIRLVPRFPHEIHIGKQTADGRTITCTICHEPKQENPAVDIGIRDEARACTLCHDHEQDGTNWTQTGWARGTSIQSCALCHTSEAGGVPGVEAVLALARSQPISVDGAQFHPTSRACTECHMDQPLGFWPSGEIGAGRIAFTTGAELRSPSLTGRDIHLLSEGVRLPRRPGDCLDCHWNGLQVGINLERETKAVRAQEGQLMEYKRPTWDQSAGQFMEELPVGVAYPGRPDLKEAGQ